MPKNNYHPLPDFSSLIRWTVQDVINWLEKNKLSSCGKLFRDAGIDGNKLYNSTEADLIGINCPKRELSIIVDLLKQAQPQKGRGYKQPNSTPKAPPRPAATITNNDEASGSEDDCGWSDTEFSDEDDDGQNGDSDSSYEQPISEPAPPVRPSRPGGSSQPAHTTPSRPRPPPPPPQESAPEVPPPRPGMRPIAQPSEEFYEEPNNDVPSRPTFAQPPLPGSRDRPPRPGERNPVPQTPPRGGRGPLPQPEEEMYEDPDEGTKGPQKPKFKAPAPPGVQNQEEDFYFDPEPDEQDRELASPPPPPPQARQSLKPGKPNIRPQMATPTKQQVVDDEEELYTDPNQSDEDIAPPLSSHKSQKPGKPNFTPPIASHSKQPAEDEEEFYTDPNQEEDIAPPPPSYKSQKPGKPNSRPPMAAPAKQQVVDDEEEFYTDPNQSEEDIAPPPPTHKAQKPGKQNFRPHLATPAKNPVVEDNQVKDSSSDSEDDLYPEFPGLMENKQFNITNRNEETLTQKTSNLTQSQSNRLKEDYEEPDSKLQPAPRPPLPRIPPAPSEEDYVETDTPAPSVVARSRRPPAPLPAPSPVVDDQEDYDQPDVGFTRTNKDSNQKHSTPSAPSGVGKKEHRSRNDPLPRPPQAQSPIVPPQSRQAPRSTMPKSEDDESDLERQKWFHGDIKRASAAARLTQYKTDGMYLIRKSSQGKDKPYTLQIWYQDKDYNLPIRIVPHNKQYAIGAERPGERTFPTLRAMVNFFKKNFLVLAGGGQTTLVKSLPR